MCIPHHHLNPNCRIFFNHTEDAQRSLGNALATAICESEVFHSNHLPRLLFKFVSLL